MTDTTTDQIQNIIKIRSFITNEEDEKILVDHLAKFDLFRCPQDKKLMNQCIKNSLPHLKIKTIKPMQHVYLYE